MWSSFYVLSFVIIAVIQGIIWESAAPMHVTILENDGSNANNNYYCPCSCCSPFLYRATQHTFIYLI